MDLKCNVAAKLARIYDNINPTYFEDRTKKYTITIESGKRKQGSSFARGGNFIPLMAEMVTLERGGSQFSWDEQLSPL
jgi:hypothetical protein